MYAKKNLLIYILKTYWLVMHPLSDINKIPLIILNIWELKRLIHLLSFPFLIPTAIKSQVKQKRTFRVGVKKEENKDEK